MDKSGCTPLWYCLALRRWTMAEYLITSGIRVSVKRAVPDLCSKRSFSLCRPRDISSGRNTPTTDRTRRRYSVLLRNNSSQMVGLLSPGTDELLNLYRNPPPPPPSPRDEGLSAIMLRTTFSDSGFSVSDVEVTPPSEADGDRRRNLRYLLALIHYASLKVRVTDCGASYGTVLA